MREASEVADLGDQPKRGECGDPAEAREDTDLAGPLLAMSDPLELAIQRVELALDAVEMDRHLLKRELRERVVQTLASDPRTVDLRPGLLALAEYPPMPEQLLKDAMAGRGPRATQIVTTAQQIAQPLGLRCRRLNIGQLAGAEEPHELLRVAAVGLDPVASTNGHQRWRDHLASHADTTQQPQQVKPTGPSLVTDRQALWTTETIDEPADRLLGRLDPLHLGLAAHRWQRRGNDRELMHIKADPQTHIGGSKRSGNVRHGWSSIRMRHRPQRSITTARLTREPTKAEGQPHNVHAD